MQELNYICCGDYYIPDIHLSEERRPIGRFGRVHREYLREYRPILQRTQETIGADLQERRKTQSNHDG